MRLLALSLCCFLLCPLTTSSGERRVQTLAYGSLTLHLGDDEKTTLAALRDRYKAVTEFGKRKFKPGVEDFIVQKQNDDIVGVITFVNGTLSKAYRDWTPNETSAYEVVRSIQGVVEAIKEDGVCTLEAPTVKEPGYLNESSMIICGSKYIEITAISSSQLPQKTTVSVHEWLDDGRSNRR
jgi:hypothetical protein